MLSFYRGHIIVLLEDTVVSAEITEQVSRTPLPTKVAALPGESRAAVLQRAKALVDAYLTTR